MRTPVTAMTEPLSQSGLVRTHALLAVQTVVIILLSINRLRTLTTGFVLPNEFLRWVDLNNMLTLPLISVVAFYLLMQHLAYGSPARASLHHHSLGVTFLIGVYLLAASYGNHEITNYLNGRFCTDDTSTICRIIAFNDDDFSHWVFFTGFVLINAAVMLTQTLFPYRGSLGVLDVVLLVTNGLFIGAGLVANLAFEEIGLDLYFVAFLAILALVLLWRRGPQPLLIYYSVAYSFGLIATLLIKVTVG